MQDEEAANIALSAGSQISDKDVEKERAAGQATAGERVCKWISDVTGPCSPPP